MSAAEGAVIAPAPLVHTPPLALLHPAARQLGYGLCPGDPDQGGYWLSRGGRCLWLPDRAAVNRVLTEGCVLDVLSERRR